VFRIQTYEHYGDIQLLNHLANVLKAESPTATDGLAPEVDNVNDRWNQLLTCIADREVSIFIKGNKGKDQDLYSSKQTHTVVAAALSRPIHGRMCRRLSPHTRACSLCSQTATRSSGLPFNGLHPRNSWNYLDYYSVADPRRDGRLSWPGWLTHSGSLGHRSTIDQA